MTVKYPLLRAAGCAAFLGAALAVFGPAIHGSPLWDDRPEIYGAAALRSGQGLAAIWSGRAGADYFPLKSTIEWIVWHAFGSSPTAFHTLSICAHALSACLLWQLLERLWQRRSFAAWLAGGIFLVHPVAVESVAWVAELKNTLSLPFLLGSALAFVGSAEAAALTRIFHENDSRSAKTSEQKRPKATEVCFSAHRREPEAVYARRFSRDRVEFHEIFGLILFAAALLTKSSVVMFPVILLLYRPSRRVLPYFGLSLVFGAVTYWFQTHRAIGDLTIPLGSPWERVIHAGHALALYAQRAVWPVHLMPIYPRFATPDCALWAIIWLAPIAAAAVWWKRIPKLTGPAMAVAFFSIMLLPVLGLLPMSYLRIAPVADHFEYISLLALAASLAAAVEFGGRRIASPAEPIPVTAATPLPSGAAARGALIAPDVAAQEAPPAIDVDRSSRGGRREKGRVENTCGPARSICFWRRSGQGPEWSAPAAEGRAANARSPAAAYAATGKLCLIVLMVCWALRSWREAHFYGDENVYWEHAVAQNPSSWLAQNNLGSALLHSGKPNDALAHLAEADRLRPGAAEVLANLADARLQTRDVAGAIAAGGDAVRAEPDFASAHYNLANALIQAGRPTEAIHEYAAAARLEPDSVEIRFNWAHALADTGDLPGAREQFAAAVRLDPTRYEIRMNYGMVLAATGQLPAAEAQFQAALALRPNDPDARQALAEARAEQPR